MHARTHLAGYEDVPADDEDALRKAVTMQPVAVGICASSSMQFYKCVPAGTPPNRPGFVACSASWVVRDLD
jgi:hypothetical protein